MAICGTNWVDSRQNMAIAKGAGEPPAGRSLLTCMIGYSLAFIIFGSQVSILGPTIRPLATRLGVDETDLSPLFTALGVSCILSGTVSGWAVDRYPAHIVLVASLLVEVTCMHACMACREHKAPHQLFICVPQQ